MADKPQTVEVEALEAHTYNGESYEVGDTYQIAADLVDSVAAQGKAVRVDRADVAKAQRKAAEKASKPVEPMTTTSRSAKALAKPKGKGRRK